jgi:hypothetical protein
MKKVLGLVIFVAAACAVAAPKHALSTLAELWYQDGDSITASNGPTSVTPQGGIFLGLGARDFWGADMPGIMNFRDGSTDWQGNFIQWRDSPSYNAFVEANTYLAGGLNSRFAYQLHTAGNAAGYGSYELKTGPDESVLFLNNTHNTKLSLNVGSSLWNPQVVLWPSAPDGETPFKLQPASPHASGNILEVGSVSVTATGEVKTGAQGWKLGSVVPATVQLVTDKYVQVEIGGQVVKLAVVE